MMRTFAGSMSARDRRTLLLGIGVVAVLVGFAKGVPAWRRWSTDARAAAAEIVAEASRAERSVALLPVMRDSLAARNGRYLGLAERILAGDTPATAAADLASFVTGTAAQSDLALGAISVRVDTLGEGRTRRTAVSRANGPSLAPAFARAVVQGDATGDIDGVTSFLDALESGPLLLVVRELAITQPDPAAPGDRPEMLRVQFTVEGLALRRGARGTTEETSGDEETAELPAEPDESMP